VAPVRGTIALSAIALFELTAVSVARAICSPSRLVAVHAEMLAATAPDCGPSHLRHVFEHARERAASATERAVVDCAIGKPLHLGRAYRTLRRAAEIAGRPATPPECAHRYETVLKQMDDDLTAAASGTETTTTTAPPGALPTTSTTQPTCSVVSLEVDRGDCTRVTSEPRGLVNCGPACDVQTFTVPASGSLRLVGTPARGDTGVTFDTDCADDGTVPLSDASPPDCSLSCDCSSGS